MRTLVALLLAGSQVIPSGWHLQKATSVDIELAMPAGFQRMEGLDAWIDHSDHSGGPRAYVSVELKKQDQPWTLAGVPSNPDCADCMSVSDLQTSTLMLDGMAFQMEIARVSGTIAHLQDAARVNAFHELSPGKWLIIEAISPTWSGRDRLLTIVRSVRRSKSH